MKTKMKNTNLKLVGISILIALVFLALGSFAFPQTHVVTQTKTVTDTINVCDLSDCPAVNCNCPVCDQPQTQIENITTTITPVDEVNNAWDYVLADWDKEEYFSDDLKECNGDVYDLDQIDWTIKDDFKYVVEDYDNNKYKVIFWVNGEYDNECENTFKVEAEYYRARDPEYTITLI